MKVITNDYGLIKLGDKVIPGVYQNMSVKNSIKIDEVDIKGASGTSKQPQGYNDAKITLTLKLQTDNQTDCYEKVEKLVSIFQNTDSNAKPYIYNVVNRLTSAWGIEEVVFDDLKTKDTNKDNTILAELHFVQYKPVVVEKEERSNLEQSDETDVNGFSGDSYSYYSDSQSVSLPPSPAEDDDIPGGEVVS
ncbi:hypothetical protein JCM16358_23210 [Halanaerocella petrolearia]